MNATLRLLLLAAALAPGQTRAQTPDAPAGATGRVALLDNDALVEGDIERTADGVRVRRSAGELTVPGDRVKWIGADRAGALAHLCASANLRDPDERVRLAQWCLLNEMRAQALEHARVADALSPGRPNVRRMVEGLETSIRSTPATPAPAPAADTGVMQASAELVTPGTPFDFNPDAFPLFVQRVQPLLMNACASCHASETYTGSFKLARVYSNPHRRLTQANLAATLGALDRRQPQVSPLLVRALTAHGGATRPAVKDRRAPAFAILAEWCRSAVVDLGGAPTPAAPPAALPEPARLPENLASTDLPPASEPFASPDAGPPAVVPAVVPAAAPVTPVTPTAVPVAPKVPAAPVRPFVPEPLPTGGADPFDPAQLNGPRGKRD